ncbi:MAG: hypothetical protein JF888_08915 [Candidatus Dormibacteraeota bacterium]|uniref:Uncharacterized protein n=1 Tax=Candidatus Dormiibacter inghamiae TaxID=3127013 RepID=A0A934NHC1_9BACT|nr:hypothetical protein [Candidatus Dormibacteraeota bacterium]MBJ7606494.1 hypothetical protein [Candidatus Dormibacteraeota bacterium]
MRALLADVSVTPDFSGLPPNVLHGLQHLTNNAAAVLMLISGLGIVVSLIMLVLASWTSNAQLSDRAKGGLVVSIGAMALLYIGVAVANYSGRLFQ